MNNTPQKARGLSKVDRPKVQAPAAAFAFLEPLEDRLLLSGIFVADAGLDTIADEAEVVSFSGSFTDTRPGGAGQWDTTQITDDPIGAEIDDDYPDLDGERLVWRGEDDIFFYDGATTVNITNTPGTYEGVPLIDGNSILYRGGAGLQLYDVTQGTTATIFTGPAAYYDIDGDNIVWLQDSASWDYLYSYTVADGQTTIIYSDYNMGPASISGDKIAFQAAGSGVTDVFLHDLGSGTTTNLSNLRPDGPGGADSDAHISGSRVVWKAFDGNDDEIYFYDGTAVQKLTDNASKDNLPKVSDDLVAWIGGEGTGADVFGFDGSVITNITNDGYSDYQVELSGTMVTWSGNSATSPGDTEIFVYDSTAGTTYQLSDTNDDETTPVISGGNVAWLGRVGGMYRDNEVFLAVASAEPSYSYSWDFGDGAAEATGTLTPQHAYADDGIYTVTLVVDDGAGVQAVDTATVTVNNVAPAITGLAVDAGVIDENGTVTLSGAIVDPGVEDTFTLALDWGDGNVQTLAYAAGSTSFSQTHQYLDDDPSGTPSDAYTIGLTLVDDDSGSGSGATSVTVNNVAPAITGLAVDAGVIDENGTVTLSGAIVDPGSEDTFTLTVDWADGNVQTFAYAAGSTAFSQTHQYLDDDPSGTPSDAYTIGLTLVDDDSGSGSGATSVTVNNVAPAITDVTGLTEAVRGQLLSYSASYTDVGTLDTHLGSWQVVDGMGELVAAGAGEAFSFTPAEVDTYSVTFTVTDDDGGSDTADVSVLIDRMLVAPDPARPGDTILFVGGSTGRDHISISAGCDPETVAVSLHEVDENINWYQTFGTVDRVVVYGQAGNDRIKVRHSLGTIPAELYGGDGNDRLRGGQGDDFLSGGNGNDLLAGYRGRDILIGGLGNDLVLGNSGDDILIGGVYADEFNRDAVRSVADEWSRTDLDYSGRVANLIDGTGLNGQFLLNDTTVFDDGQTDILLGLRGQDWFLANDQDDWTDARRSEILTDIELEFVDTL